MSDSQISEMVREYLLEGFEEISQITANLTKLEKDPANKDIINSIYRSMHTIKGASAFMQFSEIESFTHFVENTLDEMRNDTIAVTPDLIDILLNASDHITASLNQIEVLGNDEGCANKDFIANVKAKLENMNSSSENVESTDLASPAEEVAPDAEAVTPAVANAVSSTSETNFSAQEESSQPNVVVEEKTAELQVAPNVAVDEEADKVFEDLKAELEKVDLDELLEKKDLPSEKIIETSFGNEVSKMETPVEPVAAASSVAPTPNPAPNPAPTRVAPKASSGEDVNKKVIDAAVSAHNESSISDSVIKVHVNLLDKMMNVVGELVLNRNQILQYSSVSDSAELVRLANELNSITSELQSDIMATRMQPIGSVLGKFERLVRDLSRATGKKVAFRLEGQDTELDRTIIEAIKDPLTHLVRNSLDHGIETPDVRQQKGKEPMGTLLIKAYHEGGQVTIEIRDDGNGLHPEKILNKALEKGLVSQEKAQTLSENQIHHLIFTPGFSTAEKVTNISGRGVGMDVVKTNIEKIGGQVDVTSTLGEGTIFKLKIPLTLAIIPALVVRAQKDAFAIPQINLVELVRMDASNSNTIENVGKSEFLRLRGKLLPVLRLNSILGYEKPDGSTEEENLNIAILNAEGLVFGLVVDEILDTQEIVVKPLGQHLKDLDVYAGATIMGDGDVALILDALGLVQGHRKDADLRKAAESEAQSESSIGYHEGQEMILFSLNSTATFGVPLALVNRLEEFKVDQLEQVGSMSVVRYRESVMPIVDLNQFLGLKPSDSEQSAFSVLVIKNKKKYFGLKVNQVLDIQVSESSELDAGYGNQQGILGSSFVGGKTTSVIDIFKIIEQLKGESSGEHGLINMQCGKGKVALVVDDSPFFRKIEIEAMQAQGFQVLSAKNGQEALDLLQEQKVDIVLSDIEMPVMSGLELAKQVRSMDAFKTLPMVAISTRSDKETIEKGIASGFSIYLEKFNKDEVMEAVSKCVGRAS